MQCIAQYFSQTAEIIRSKIGQSVFFWLISKDAEKKAKKDEVVPKKTDSAIGSKQKSRQNERPQKVKKARKVAEEASSSSASSSSSESD